MKLKNVSGYTLAILLVMGWMTSHAMAAGLQQLSGHVPDLVKEGKVQDMGRLDATKPLWLAVQLPWRNPQELQTLIQELYDPSSPQYHHYLTVKQFTDTFSPTQEDYQSVIAFMKSKGLKVTQTPANRFLVDVEGASATIEKAFNVQLHNYERTDGTQFYAPDREPSLDLSTPISHIIGLDNANPPHPLYKQRPANELPSANVITNRVKGMAVTAEGDGTGVSGCSGCYIGNDLRDAYAPGVTLNGAGQVSSIIAIDGILQSDITTYEGVAGLPNVPLEIVLIDGFDGTVHDPPNGENSLDIEQQISMAPGLSKLMVYEGSQNIDDDINQVAVDDIAKTTSVSYGWGPDTTLSSLGQEFAAQGQSLFIAAGDSGAYVGGESGDAASENPYITVVGGTDLYTTGPGGSWQSETAWEYGGGGVGLDYSIPSYQVGISMAANGGSTTNRDVPDVSMDSNFDYLIIASGEYIDYIGGTSCSTPLWAAFTSMVNEQAANNGKPSVGFINPAIYTIGQGSDYTKDFHDITSGNNNSTGNGGFNAVAGYDLATGWGSPAGQDLINDLSKSAGAPTATITPTPTPIVASTWRVRAGGVAYTDSQNHVWAADENYSGGSTNSSAASITGALPSSTDQALYQDERYENPTLTYTFHVPSGSYQVTLKFAELFDNGAGERIMNVSINGIQELTNFDIYSAAGGLDIAKDEVFSNIASSNGEIVVQFSATSSSPDQNAKVDALQIIPQPATPTNTPTNTLTPTKTATPTNTFTITSTFTVTPTATPVVESIWRVAGGKTASYTDCQGNVWSPDENYNAGSFNSNTNTISKALPCATDQSLYQSEHWNAKSFTYTFNVPSGSYQTTLKFAEIFDNAAGDRIQDVTINGTQVLTNFDIFSDAGGMNIADDKVFNNIAPVNGQIVITFATTSTSPDQNAKVSAIAIIPQPSTPTPTATSSATGTSTSTVTSTPTLTATNTLTSTSTSTASFTATATNSNTATFTASLTPTASFTPTATNSNTFTPILTSTGTVVIQPTSTSTHTATSTLSPTVTPTPTSTNTSTLTSTSTPTATNSVTSTLSATWTSTSTRTNSPTSSATWTSTWTRTFTNTPTASFTWTYTPVPPTNTSTKTVTPVPPTNTPTKTLTPVPPTNTPTKTLTPVPPTFTFTPTPASACSGVPVWNGNFVAYATGSEVTYDNELYQCIQGHTSEPNWMPPVVPALWKDLGPCSTYLPADMSSSSIIKSAVAGPNISRNFQPVRFFIDLNGPAKVDIDIFSLMGQQVASDSFYGNTGFNSWLWDVRNGSNSNVGSGLYIYVIRAYVQGNVETKKGKIAILH